MAERDTDASASDVNINVETVSTISPKILSEKKLGRKKIGTNKVITKADRNQLVTPFDKLLIS